MARTGATSSALSMSLRKAKVVREAEDVPLVLVSAEMKGIVMEWIFRRGSNIREPKREVYEGELVNHWGRIGIAFILKRELEGALVKDRSDWKETDRNLIPTACDLLHRQIKSGIPFRTSRIPRQFGMASES